MRTRLAVLALACLAALACRRDPVPKDPPRPPPPPRSASGAVAGGGAASG